MGKELFYIAFDVSTLPDRKLLDDVSALEDIIMVGYPNGIWDEKNNKPIFRKGITATDIRFDTMVKKNLLLMKRVFQAQVARL